MIINSEKKIRIMIVEDEVISAMYLQMELKKKNYDVLNLVNTGEQAVKLSQMERPDIILMDIHLAGKMDGIQTANKILTDFEGFIIFMTGFDDEALKNEINKLPSSGCIVKPVEIKSLIETIESGIKLISKSKK